MSVTPDPASWPPSAPGAAVPATTTTHGTHSVRRSAFLKDRIVLISGAERGVGLAIANAACEVGATTVLTGGQEDLLKAEAKRLKNEGLQALFAPVDITHEGQVREVFTGVHERFGRLDIVIHNAGAGVFKSIADHTLDDWYLQLQMNLTGAFLVMRESLRLMSYRRDGHLVVINSTTVRRPLAGPSSAYNATRTALSVLVDGLREEAANLGVRVTQFLVGAAEVAKWDANPATPADARSEDAVELARLVLMQCRSRNGAAPEEIVYSPGVGGSGFVTR